MHKLKQAALALRHGIAFVPVKDWDWDACLHPHEREECARRTQPQHSAAARVAARRALARILCAPVSPGQAWIAGWPRPRFHFAAAFAARHALGEVDVSLSHVNMCAGALVTLNGACPA
jgi:phosphopantetheinyl transferase (holo-ACP synthase)